MSFLIDQGRRFHPKLSKVSMKENKKVGSDFIEMLIHCTYTEKVNENVNTCMNA